jgi:hypothetical protein
MVPVPEKKIPTDAEKKANLERFKKSAEQKINSASTSDMIKKMSKKKTGGSTEPPFRFRTREERQTNKLNKTDKKIKDLESNLEGMSEKRNLNIEGSSESELGAAKLQQLKNKRARIDKTLNKTIQKNPESKLRMAKTGGKSMEPGGGGRFASMVSKLKGKGKSEGSAKAIAASIGRKKYGKSKFQEMAAKGKKGLGGSSDSTGSNEAGMQMIKKKKNKR